MLPAHQSSGLDDLARGWPSARDPDIERFRKAPLTCESGRRESNPHGQLGRLELYH
jgi:hypothetical protein